MLAVVALVLATANVAVYNGAMAGGVFMSAAGSMDEGGCADCPADGNMATCISVVCPFFAALLPDTATVRAGEILRFPLPDRQIGSGQNPFPDTGPPRTIIAG